MKNLTKKLFRMFTLVLSVLCATIFVACGSKDKDKNGDGGKSAPTAYELAVQRQNAFAEELNELANPKNNFSYISKGDLGSQGDKISSVTRIGDNYFVVNEKELYVKNGTSVVNIVPDRHEFTQATPIE